MSLPFDVSDEWVLSSDDSRPFAFVYVFENFFPEPVTYLSSSFHLSTRSCSLFCPNLSDIALHILSIIPLPKTSLSLHCLDKEPTLCFPASPKQTGVSSCLSPLWVACQVDNHKVTHYIFPFTTTLGSPHFQWNLKHDCVLPFWGLAGWVSFPWKNIDILWNPCYDASAGDIHKLWQILEPISGQWHPRDIESCRAVRNFFFSTFFIFLDHNFMHNFIGCYYKIEYIVFIMGRINMLIFSLELGDGLLSLAKHIHN